MRLLTPKVAVSLRKMADRLGKLLAIAGTEDMETLVRLIQGGLRESVPKLPEDSLDFDPDSGILFDEDWSDTWGEARQERLRRIGEAGERCAFRAIVDYFIRLGFALETEDGGLVRLSLGERKAEVRRPDTEEFHQPGWNIEVKILQGEQEEQCYYLEVKTHTPRSRVRALLPLSDTQMRLAARPGENYVLLLVIYDEAAEQVLSWHPFSNVAGHLAIGTLRSAEGRFVLRVGEI